MKTSCSYAATNSANATIVASTENCLFCGASIAGGDGTLTIKAGTATFLVLKTTADADTANFAPTLPTALAAGLNATCSGTGVCTLFYAVA